MKRKNLFLSLICSLILTVALVTVTVLSIVPKKGEQNGNGGSTNVSDGGVVEPDITINEGRDGLTAENAFIINSVEAFNTFVVGKYLDENGEYIDYTKTGEEGLAYPELNAGLYYELANDIDFAGVDFKPMFNKGIPFNGHIDGKGFALKNISINVNKENLVSDFTYKSGTQLVSNIAIFGETKNAEIKNVKIADMEVSVEEDLYSHVWSAEFQTEVGTMKSISVSSLVGTARNTTIQADAVSSINGFAYVVYANNIAAGTGSIGGLVANAIDSTISNSNVKTNIIANQGARYYVGGLAGCVLNTTMKNVNAQTVVQTKYTQALHIGGLVGYAMGLNVDSDEGVKNEVALTVAESGTERFVTAGVTSIDNKKFVSIAGVVKTIDITDKKGVEHASTIKNVNVVSNIDIDGIFAGAVIEVANGKTNKVVELVDIIAESNVNVLQAYGFAYILNSTKVVFSEENFKSELLNADEEPFNYNVKIVGKAKLDSDVQSGFYPASLFVLSSTNCEGVDGTARKSVKVIVSYEIVDDIRLVEKVNNYKFWGAVATI